MERCRKVLNGPVILWEFVSPLLEYEAPDLHATLVEPPYCTEVIGDQTARFLPVEFKGAKTPQALWALWLKGLGFRNEHPRVEDGKAGSGRDRQRYGLVFLSIESVSRGIEDDLSYVFS